METYRKSKCKVIYLSVYFIDTVYSDNWDAKFIVSNKLLHYDDFIAFF